MYSSEDLEVSVQYAALVSKIIPFRFMAYKLINTHMPKMMDYVALWKKYQRECVPQKYLSNAFV